jgi:histone demethylase JARID1
MAYHLEDQKSYQTCKMLLDEIKRIMDEEIHFRNKLLRSGIRDISKDVDLPQNRFDELDEESADYDDKRLCFACKHICFLSCIACKCSTSKVSCLRHSHYMCRCPSADRFMMVWCTAEEMKKTYKRVKECTLRLKEIQEGKLKYNGEHETDLVEDNFLAPGVLEDLKRHEGYVVNLGETSSSLRQIPHHGQRLRRKEQTVGTHSSGNVSRKRKM